MTVQAYRFFTDNCREAMTRYQQILGGELFVMGFDEMPPGEDAPEGIDPNLVMHAAITFPDGGFLMASDDPSGDGGPTKGVSLYFGASSVEDGERIFGELSEGGEIGMPWGEVFWALRFGSCTDRFGTSWMIAVDHPPTT
jgi:PhnB protein